MGDQVTSREHSAGDTHLDNSSFLPSSLDIREKTGTFIQDLCSKMGRSFDIILQDTLMKTGDCEENLGFEGVSFKIWSDMHESRWQ